LPARLANFPQRGNPAICPATVVPVAGQKGLEKAGARGRKKPFLKGSAFPVCIPVSHQTASIVFSRKDAKSAKKSNRSFKYNEL
jgi:hypothetical protein